MIDAIISQMRTGKITPKEAVQKVFDMMDSRNYR